MSFSNEDIEIVGLEDNPTLYEDDEIGSTYDPKSVYQKPLLVQEAVRACREARGKEMIKGFWNTKLDKLGNAISTWHEDERKIYINNVIALYSLLTPECREDEKFRKRYKFLKRKIKEIKEKYAYHEFEYEPKTTGWKRSEHSYIPQIDEELMIPSPLNPKLLVNIKGGWNNKINAYYDSLVPYYDSLFRELNMVINRIQDFSQKVTY